jgi:hypothetical protein
LWVVVRADSWPERFRQFWSRRLDALATEIARGKRERREQGDEGDDGGDGDASDPT